MTSEKKICSPLYLISSDSVCGRILSFVKTILDVAISLIINPSRENFRIARYILKLRPNYTMVRTSNLATLYTLAAKISKEKVPGDIVECGVWNGGSAAITYLGLTKESDESSRRIWLFDSFQGLPPPSKKDGEIEQRYYFSGLNKGSISNVKRIFAKIGCSPERLQIVPGWFQDTLDKSEVPIIALLHIDADWYESVKLVLNTFFDRVAKGGYIILDDYGYWQGCKQALDEFISVRKLHGIDLCESGKTGVHFQKP